ncbi:hypothetical protein JCM14036_02980 [Desulfotomaculum defluvii]
MSYGDMDKQRVAFFLANYPVLWANIESQRENIIERYRQSAVAGGRSGNQPSDQTAKKAIQLLEISELMAILNLVRQWIDYELIQKARPLLLAVWRVGRYGWDSVAKDLNAEVWRCRDQWQQLTESLLHYLQGKSPSAGAAKEQDGRAFAPGLKR